ncbi:MAG: DUF309 domain-containing protein [Chloroflexi bacterium]|nr:MAG: DUF309 domain-containing protein [Chloroflexota bacterium]
MSTESDVTQEEISCACEGELPRMASYGLELFNRREFFEAHEALETAWRDETGPVRELYRGILQIAVAYLHIQRGNYRGAVKMFFRSRPWLDPFPDTCRGINLLRFRQDYARVEKLLHRLGPDRLSSFDYDLFKPIDYTEREGNG